MQKCAYIHETQKSITSFNYCPKQLITQETDTNSHMHVFIWIHLGPPLALSQFAITENLLSLHLFKFLLLPEYLNTWILAAKKI